MNVIKDKEKLERYYLKMNDYSMKSHKNQLIQESAELIKSITKINQRLLNNQIPSADEINNFPIEMLHVKLIIDYLITVDKGLSSAMNKEFFELCVMHGVE